MATRFKKKQLTDFKAVLQAAPDLYLILNSKFDIIEVSEAYLRATKVKRKDILGQGIFDVFPDNPNDPTATGAKNLRASLERVLKSKIPDTMAVQKYDIRRPKSEGGGFEEHYWSPLNSPILGKNKKVKYIIHRVEDVTEFIRLQKSRETQQKMADMLRSHVGEMEREIYRRAQEIQETNKQLRLVNDELEHIAFFDTLTKLPNRKQLMKRIKQSLALAKHHHWKIAVLFLDLDHFKKINDTLGHKIGDQLLQIVSQRLCQILKEEDIAARLGGDEFIIMLDKLSNCQDAANIAERILNSLKKPIKIDNHILFVSGSIGISFFPENGEDEISLLKHADIAMYYAKETGRNAYQFCTPDMIKNIQKKINLEQELREALKNDKFILHYQPQVDLKTGKITGVEALLRLTRSDGSLLLPNEFITLAEETGLIVPIGEHVFYTACKNYKDWEKQFLKENGFPLKLAVNFSARQLKEPNFLTMLQKIMKKTNFDPKNLEFEITEHPIIGDINASAQILKKLKSIGVHVALDDFGLGYSSLNYLRQFEIDTLKMEKSLVANVPNDKTDSEIVTSIIDMAHAMKIAVIAEGVEHKEQIEFLISQNCDKVQSYYFSEPLSFSSVTELLRKNVSWQVVH
jgi:diguanylate cyclase (GGDEF)-like protein